MALLDIWDYVRVMGDRRLRKQGYVRSGMGILERYRRVAGFWAPHLEHNRNNLLEIAQAMGTDHGGTLLILGAGRLLDIPWEQLFPCFERVVLADADYCVVPYVERAIAASRAAKIPQPVFEIGDLTASVVDLAAWAEHAIASSVSASAAAKSLAEGFDRAGTPQPQWARTYADVRLVVSTNLISQLGYFPRLHVQNEFRARFKSAFSEQHQAAERLECYFDRVRARHIHDLAAQSRAWAYVSTDIDAVTYALRAGTGRGLLAESVPPEAGVTLNAQGELRLHWPADILEHSDPLHGQKVKELWPPGARLGPVRRWAWHIVPQGSEKKYMDRGRVHLVEAWTKRP